MDEGLTLVSEVANLVDEVLTLAHEVFDLVDDVSELVRGLGTVAEVQKGAEVHGEHPANWVPV